MQSSDEVQPESDAPRRFSRGGVVVAILIGLLLGAGYATYRYVYHEVIFPAQQARRMGQLKNLGIALHNYHLTYNRFPPAFTLDEQGQPLTSWRVLLLPFLDEPELYARYDQTKPWDSPENLPLVRQMPQALRDQGIRASRRVTPFLAVLGSAAALDPRQQEARFAFTKAGATEIMLIHSPRHQVPWTKPQDFAPRDVLTLPTVEESPYRAPLVLTERTDYRTLTAEDREQILAQLPPTVTEEDDGEWKGMMSNDGK